MKLSLTGFIIKHLGLDAVWLEMFQNFGMSWHRPDPGQDVVEGWV
jgi:hypothetical protein